MKRDALNGQICSRLLSKAAFVFLSVAMSLSANSQSPPPSQPIVVLISLGGFRWDYAARDGARNLLALGKAGVSAPQGMLPSFPAATWPNEWTLVTGLYPGHHGIVADRFYDPARGARFAASDAEDAGDGAWYGGVPLWALAEKQGIRTACIDWPGCAAEVAGTRPSLMTPDKTPSSAEAKAQQIAAWLRLPAAERPRLVVAYFSEVDAAGRSYGPDGLETRAAVRTLDGAVGRLKAALDATNLPIDLVVVSDHGMAKEHGMPIVLESFADLSGFDTQGALLYGKSEADRARVYSQLKKASSDFFAYRLKDVPASLHLYANPRFGDPVMLATGAVAIFAHAPSVAGSPDQGLDGLNVQTAPEMKGIFFAAGPDIVAGKTVAPFQNVHVYPWLAHLLGLTAPKNDGDLNILSGTLRDGGNTIP